MRRSRADHSLPGRCVGPCESRAGGREDGRPRPQAVHRPDRVQKRSGIVCGWPRWRAMAGEPASGRGVWAGCCWHVRKGLRGSGIGRSSLWGGRPAKMAAGSASSESAAAAGSRIALPKLALLHSLSVDDAVRLGSILHRRRAAWRVTPKATPTSVQLAPSSERANTTRDRARSCTSCAIWSASTAMARWLRRGPSPGRRSSASASCTRASTRSGCSIGSVDVTGVRRQAG